MYLRVIHLCRVYLFIPEIYDVSHLFGRRNPSVQERDLGEGEVFLLLNRSGLQCRSPGHLNWQAFLWTLAALKVFADCWYYSTKLSKEVNLVPHASEEGVSKVMETGAPATGQEMQQNVHFDDAHPGFEDTRGEVSDPLRNGLVDSDISLQGFFQRPIKIATFEWPVGGVPVTTSAATQINPWSLYFNDKRVVNRISNYKLMKATLNIKFVINGNAFYYGRALVSYRPLHNLDNTTVLVPGNFPDLIEASQRPHIWLNPTLSQGGVMKLPFFTPLNMLDVANSEWQDMGVLDIEAPAVLEHANGATDIVTIACFAWAENVELTGLTQQNPTTIVAQGMEESGIISKPASNVAKVAGLFKSVPYISAFATATEIGARAIGSMAALFGYSKPVREDIPPLQPLSRQSMANCDGRENLLKLTVDPCNELSIDPKIAALDMPDELTINGIANRESLLTKFDWAVTVPTETCLFNIIVDPCVLYQVGTGVNAPMHLPAVAFATFPFEYWKGTLRYRFQVVCSGFHKGRLKIVYDPYGVPQTATVADPAEYNVAYTEIVDIAECNDFTVDVGWGQNTAFRQHLNFPQILGNSFASASGTTPAPALGLNSANTIGVGNGTLAVYVVNELTTPNSTVMADIEVLVSVSACDDYEVAAPTDFYLNRLALTPITTPQGMIEPQGADEDMLNLDNPVVDPGTIRYMGSTTVTDKLINRIHMGEAIASFRQMLKRYNLHEVFCPAESGEYAGMYKGQRRMFPFYGGYTTSTPSDSNLIITLSTGAGNYAYARLTLMNYLTPAFGAWRGGVRYTVDTTFNEIDNALAEPIAFTSQSTWEVSRIGNIAERTLAETVDSDPAFSQQITFQNVPADNRWAALANSNMGLSGSTRWNTQVNPIQSFEIPYYSKYRFAPARQKTLWASKDVYQDSFNMVVTQGATAGPDLNFVYVAAAEDFTLMFYLSPPIFYSQTIPDPSP